MYKEEATELARSLSAKTPFFCKKCTAIDKNFAKKMDSWEPYYKQRIAQFTRQMTKKRDRILAEARGKEDSRRPGEIMKKCPECPFKATLLKKGNKKKKKRWGSSKLLSHFESNHAPQKEMLKEHSVFQCAADKCEQDFCTYNFEIMSYHLVSR